MEITGKIIVVGNVMSGVSKKTGKPWATKEYVIETEETYPRKCVFSVFGEDRIKEFNIQMNERLTISIDIDAREYNGRYFNSITAWRVDRGGSVGSAPATSPAAAPAVQPSASPSVAKAAPDDDLPF